MQQPLPFAGPQCHVGYDPCAKEYQACSGHGVCIRQGKHQIDFKCACDVAWEGKHCDRRRPVCLVANETAQEICLNGGVCKDLNAETGAYICECAPGWWGETCEKPTSVLYVSPL